jgi:hypothetical protein
MPQSVAPNGVRVLSFASADTVSLVRQTDGLRFGYGLAIIGTQSAGAAKAAQALASCRTSNLGTADLPKRQRLLQNETASFLQSIYTTDEKHAHLHMRLHIQGSQRIDGVTKLQTSRLKLELSQYPVSRSHLVILMHI